MKRRIWIDAIEKFQQFDYAAAKFFVCELHFLPEQIMRSGGRTDLVDGSVPTIFKSPNVEFLDEDWPLVAQKLRTETYGFLTL